VRDRGGKGPLGPWVRQELTGEVDGAGGGIIGGGGAQVCGEKWRQRWHFRASQGDSAVREEEGGEAELGASSEEDGKVQNADDGRRPSSVLCERAREREGERAREEEKKKLGFLGAAMTFL
jgi:hypothetical protein